LNSRRGLAEWQLSGEAANSQLRPGADVRRRWPIGRFKLNLVRRFIDLDGWSWLESGRRRTSALFTHRSSGL